jgi:hypothetical protein
MLVSIKYFFTRIWDWLFGAPPVEIEKLQAATPPSLPDATVADIEPVLQPVVSPRHQLELSLYEQRRSPVLRSNLLSLFESATLDDLLYLRTKVVSQKERAILQQVIEAKSPIDEDGEPTGDDIGRTCPPSIPCLSAWFDDGAGVTRDIGSTAPHEDFFSNFPNCKPPVR